MIFDRLSEDILKNEYFIKLYLKLSRSLAFKIFGLHYNDLTEREYLDLMRFSDILSNSSIANARNLALKIIALINNDIQDNLYCKIYSTAILAKLGNFPGLKQLGHETKLPFHRQVEKDIKAVIQQVPGKTEIFTDPQYALYRKIRTSNFYSFSGPTSLGKSFIIKTMIRQIVISPGTNNITIIVPTRALINEFSLELRKELGTLLEEHNYKIMSSFNTPDSLGLAMWGYIFVVTPERLLNYLSGKDNPRLSHLFVDEAHKLATGKDTRSITLYLAIERALKKYPELKLYFASPNVSNPEVFLELFAKEKRNSFKTAESPVSQNLFFIDIIENTAKHITELMSYDLPLKRKYASSLDAIHQLSNNYSSIIYCNSTAKITENAMNFKKYTNYKNSLLPMEKIELEKAAEIVKELIHDDYYLIECLKHGIGFHFGGLPQLIRNKVEALFKKGIIKYLFCTSTLLEGVNLPAKNVFILSNKNGLSRMSRIDFWNLAGRAGRLNMELAGNIFCIKDNRTEWTDIKLLEDKSDIKLKPSVTEQISKNNLKKIEAFLKYNKLPKGADVVKQLLKYLSNIICIDTLDLKSNYTSPVISKLIADNKEQLIEYAKEAIGKTELPKEIMDSNRSIWINDQNRVYTYIVQNKHNEEEIILPADVTYESCCQILYKFYDIYNWEHTEKELKNSNTIPYYAQLMNRWVNGQSLKQIISNSLDFYQEKNRNICYFKNSKITYEPFIFSNKHHVNLVINEVIKNIERVLRITLEKYFNNYYQILTSVIGEENSGNNWGHFLEYGTKNPMVITLQNMGFSRHVANILIRNKEYRKLLLIKDGVLVGFNKEGLLQAVNKDSVVYEEVSSLLFY